MCYEHLYITGNMRDIVCDFTETNASKGNINK